MHRDLSELASREYDLVIVGGGIFGVCAAWDAALRGLSVALLEASDFGHAASANCFKMIHGGIRYLQHADVVRVRQSAAERSALLRIAPHLSSPLPIFIPTYGRGMKSKPVLSDHPALARVIARAAEEMGSRGRVLVRYSGTEPLARVMTEGNDADEIRRIAEQVAAELRDHLG